MGAVPTMGLFRAPGSFSELEVMHQQLVAMENEIGAPNHVLRDSDDVHTIAALLLRVVAVYRILEGRMEHLLAIQGFGEARQSAEQLLM